MKKVLSYLLVFSIIFNIFMIDINVFSYEFIDIKNKGIVNSLKNKIYDIYDSYNKEYKETPANGIGLFSGSLCPDGITVQGYGTLSLEDYVAGVIQHEAYTGEGIEALKAQAIAARTYAVNSTDYCKRSIGNSTASQTFSATPSASAVAAAKATSGMIMTYNGKIFSSQYDSFCYEDGDCRDSRFSGSGYTVTYTKVPSSEKHLVSLTDSNQFGRITKGQGHAHGMSQLVSYQMAKEGKSYDEILRYFYATGIEIVRPSSSVNWKQCDSQWGSTKIDTKTMCSVGCYVTSLAILIAQSGATTTLGADFNPGTFLNYLKSNGAFDGNALNSLSSISRLVNVFTVHERDYNTSVDNIRNYLSQGKYLQMHIIRADKTEHFMAITGVEGDKVYISDPGTSCTVLSDCYPESVLHDLRVYTIG